MNRFIKILFILFMLLKPFYFLSSGSLQIADFVMIFIFAHFLLNMKRTSVNSITVKLLLVFLFYVVFINSLWIIINKFDVTYVKSSIYLLYNVMVFISVRNLFKSDIIRTKDIALGVFLSLTIQVVLMLIMNVPIKGARVELFFNNPNQLGFYGLLMVITTMAIYNNLKKPILSFFCILLGTFLVLISLSKAAIISVAIAILVFIVLQYFGSIKGFLSVIIITLIVIISGRFILEENFNSFYDSLIFRMNNIGNETDDNLAFRGYDRIVQHPEYLFLGAGEGDFDRFDTMLVGGEIHSTIGNILFSYGIIGIILISKFILLLYHNTLKLSLYTLFPVMLYGITHNGFRGTLFWILLAYVDLYYILHKEELKHG
ncbi:hypothetical protein RI065_11430 [Mycoplasmatota bacterium zrk1]